MLFPNLVVCLQVSSVVIIHAEHLSSRENDFYLLSLVVKCNELVLVDIDAVLSLECVLNCFVTKAGSIQILLITTHYLFGAVCV